MSIEPHDRILLVEGRDDAEVVKQFCNHYRIDNRRLFRIEIKNGIEALQQDLRIRARAGVQVLGVVLDADDDPLTRWHQVREAMRQHRYELPERPDAAGTPLLPEATAAVDAIDPGVRRFPLERRSKAVAHTWLAWQEEPGTPLGLAITRRYLDPSRDPAPAFRDWLIELFAPTEPSS